MTAKSTAARIILEDGTEYEGTAFGYAKSAAGEIVMYTGYPDFPRILTNPALKSTILIASHPMAGAAGFTREHLCPLGLETDYESASAHIAGLVVASFAPHADHWTAHKTIHLWLRKHRIPGISGIDTRALIQRVSRRGSMRAKILIEDANDISFSSAGRFNHPSFVSVKQPVSYGSGKKRIIAVDCGIRNTTLRYLAASGCTITRVPWNYDYSSETFDALCIAGGPGEPSEYDQTVSILASVLSRGIPVMGTGLGAVLLALAGGASTYKIPQGHYNPAIPCIDQKTGTCIFTSQCHRYGIRTGTLPDGWEVSYLNSTDGSIEGFYGNRGLISGYLFMPEGISGASSTSGLFSRFYDHIGDKT
ncbi:MAG: Carbamoyl-phosphate synthase small chain [Spirochaetes bacterium ADurb.Bin269]|nr:MAG: Carbamoyl-phosphate synthase small chain [Spirochaetes bacterium ADurb.Bin269]